MGVDTLKISVNLCSRDLMNPRIVQIVDQMLEEVGVDASDLEIELTEPQALELGVIGFHNIDEMRQRGIAFVLDDFGRGYSALNCLRDLPINKVKLDQIFLRDLPHDEASCTMVESLIKVANALNLEVVAEGVETPEQAEFLRSCKCSAMQGFLYSPARPADEISKWLMNGRQKTQYIQHGNKQHSH